MPEFIYIALHKPKGVLSDEDPADPRPTVRDLVPVRGHLFSVGRLDLDSEGLILLTNDGMLANRLTHPRYEHEKEYRVQLAVRPDEEQLNTWRRGVVLEDGVKTAPAQVTLDGFAGKGSWLTVILKEGRKREIREVGRRIGLPVFRIVRVRIGTLYLGTLKPRDWRYLTADEVRGLKSLADRDKIMRGGAGRTRARPGIPASRGVRNPAPRAAGLRSMGHDEVGDKPAGSKSYTRRNESETRPTRSGGQPGTHRRFGERTSDEGKPARPAGRPGFARRFSERNDEDRPAGSNSRPFNSKPTGRPAEDDSRPARPAGRPQKSKPFIQQTEGEEKPARPRGGRPASAARTQPDRQNSHSVPGTSRRPRSGTPSGPRAGRPGPRQKTGK